MQRAKWERLQEGGLLFERTVCRNLAEQCFSDGGGWRETGRRRPPSGADGDLEVSAFIAESEVTIPRGEGEALLKSEGV